jgi:hypothetical protein
MTVLTPGHWRRFHPNTPEDLVQWECPVCRRSTNTKTGLVRDDGTLAAPQRHSACGFFDIVKLSGWIK